MYIYIYIYIFKQMPTLNMLLNRLVYIIYITYIYIDIYIYVIHICKNIIKVNWMSHNVSFCSVF